MKKLFTGIICLLLVINQIAAQKNSKEIKGDKYYSFYSFDKAIEKYTQSDDLTIEGQRKLANSYFNSENTTKSEEVYAKYINQTGITSEDIYNYASVLRTNGKYEESNKWMDKFKEMNPNDLRAKNYAASNDKLTNLLKDEGRYKIDHLNINSNQQDFGT
jgi:tetratricopeptide (TPR) repeat protein